MRPPLWHPPLELSTAEQAIIKRIRRAKLFVFLRQHRHALFADAFQQEFLTLYKDQPQGQPPCPLPNWPSRRCSKRIRRSPMTK